MLYVSNLSRIVRLIWHCQWSYRYAAAAVAIAGTAVDDNTRIEGTTRQEDMSIHAEKLANKTRLGPSQLELTDWLTEYMQKIHAHFVDTPLSLRTAHRLYCECSCAFCMWIDVVAVAVAASARYYCCGLISHILLRQHSTYSYFVHNSTHAQACKHGGIYTFAPRYTAAFTCQNEKCHFVLSFKIIKKTERMTECVAFTSIKFITVWMCSVWYQILSLFLVNVLLSHLLIHRASVRPFALLYHVLRIVHVMLVVSAQKFGRFRILFLLASFVLWKLWPMLFLSPPQLLLFVCTLASILFRRLLFAASHHIQSRSFKFCLYYNFVWVQKLLLPLFFFASFRFIYIHEMWTIFRPKYCEHKEQNVSTLALASASAHDKQFLFSVLSVLVSSSGNVQ